MIPHIFVNCYQPSADDWLLAVLTQVSGLLVCAVLFRSYWESVTATMLWLCTEGEDILYKMGLCVSS